MKLLYGPYKEGHGPGVDITLTSAELAQAIETWLMAQGIYLSGPRTITVNDGQLCDNARVIVDPSGFVAMAGQRISGRGPGA